MSGYWETLGEHHWEPVQTHREDGVKTMEREFSYELHP